MTSKRASKKPAAVGRRTRKPRSSSVKGAGHPAMTAHARAGRSLRLTAALTPEGGGYVAQCIEVDVASQGDTVEEALANLREALELYFEDESTVVPEASPIIAPIELTL